MITIRHEAHAPSVLGPRWTADSIPPHHLPQRSPTVAEAPDWRRVPHAVSPFRLIGVIRGGRT